jgi:hypothetical protein
MPSYAIRPSLLPSTCGRMLVLGLLSTLCIPTNAHADITVNRGLQYANECINKGVPSPPDWATTGWTYRGELENGDTIGERDFNVVSTTAQTYVYTFSDASGVCYALPRVPKGTQTTSAFGVICQGKSGKACFWERGPTAWPMPTFTSIIGTFRGGTDLTQADNCSNCHAGANAFIIHPGSKLDVPGLDVSTTSGWYEPIIPAHMGPAGFAQNPRPPTTPDKYHTVPSNEAKCSSCHGPSSGREFPLFSTQTKNGTTGLLQDITLVPPPAFIGAKLPMMPPVPYTASFFAASTTNLLTVQAKGMLTTASVTRGSNRIDNFLLDPGGTIYHVFWDTASWRWEKLPVSLTTVSTTPLVAISAASWGNNRIDLIAYNTAGQFIWIYFNGIWNVQNIGNGFGYTAFAADMGLTAASWGVNRIDVFIQGQDTNIRQLWYDGTIWRWEFLGNSWGGTKFKQMTAISWGPGRLDVIGPAMNGQVKQLWTENSPWNWSDLGPVAGRWTGAVAGVAQASNRLDIVGTNVNGDIERLNWNGSGWAWATTLVNAWDAGLYGPIAISSWASGRLDIVGPALDGKIKHVWRNTATSPNWNFAELGNFWK